MKSIKIVPFIILLFLYSSSFSQIDKITWQQCFGTTGYDGQDWVRGATKFNDGYLFGISITQDEPWISNYHGSTDAWIINTDSLGNIIWEKCYGGSKGDGPQEIIPIDSNFIYLVNGTASNDGDVQNFTNEYYDNWVIKINKYGDIIWENCYGGPDVEEPRDALLTSDGGLLLMSRITAAGGDISNFYGGIDIWVCKIDSQGTIQWEKTLGNHGFENAITMEYTSDTTFFILGGVNESGGMVDCDCNVHPTGYLDVWLIEMDIYGNIIRQLCYGGTGYELLTDIVITEGGYVFTSSTSSYDGDVTGLHGLDDIWVVKIDNVGNIIWEKCLGGSKLDWPRYITQTQDKGLVIIGETKSSNGDVSNNHSNFGTIDTWVIKLDQYGILQWEHCFGSMDDERVWTCNNIIKISDYDYVVAVQSKGISGDIECELNPEPGTNSPDAWIINIKDCSKFQPTKPQKPAGIYTLCVNTDSITTYNTTHAYNAWYYEWQLQPEEAGTPLNDSITTTINWNPNYEGPATLKVRSSNDCGESTWSDSLVIQTYMCLGAEENPDQNTFRVYPNPTSSTLIIDIKDINNAQNSKIEIYNTMGYKVVGIEATGNITSINVGDWAKGIYFVRASIGDFVYSRKIVVD